ncbi:mycothiol conjugate amidase Mca [Nocardiopsis gilva]
MARYVSEGAEVLVVTLTGGERGSILNPAMDRPEIVANIGEVRRKEMAEARQILGVHQEFSGFVDSGLPEGDPLPPLPEGCFALQPLDVASEPLVRSVRSFKPHVMITYDENGGYPHPDHIMTHKVSVEAFDAAGDPERYPEAGDPWQPLKLYYHVSFPRVRFEALSQMLDERELENPYKEWMKRIDERKWPEWEITTQVRCDEHFETRDRALIAHATQIDPNGFWFAVPMDVQREAWPYEDYHLARSLVDTDIPEKDLFAGVREAVRA